VVEPLPYTPNWFDNPSLVQPVQVVPPSMIGAADARLVASSPANIEIDATAGRKLVKHFISLIPMSS
jgi:hypothetical protein